MKATKEDMEVFSKILEGEVKKIEGAIARFRLAKQPLDFETIQDAIVSMAMRLPEFWEPGESDDGQGGVTADLNPNGPKKTPAKALTIPR